MAYARGRQPCSRLALSGASALLVYLSAVAASPAEPLPERPPLVIDKTGCHYPPDIERALGPFPRYSDMREHLDTRPARFAFGPLHGVGVGKAWDAEWSEERLYFAEDTTTVIAFLRRIGFHLDRHGSVSISPAIEDEVGLSVEASALKAGAKDRVPRAHTVLSCGSF